MEYYNKDSVLFLRGEFVKARNAGASLFSQTLHYGYGAFEGIRSYNTIHGTKIFKPHEHFSRLIKSCEMLSIPIHHTVEELTQISYQLLEKNGLSNAYIRPLVTTGEDLTLSAPKESSLMICAWEWDKYFVSKEASVCISSYQRPKSNKSGAKVCGHYVNSVLAFTEAKERGFDGAIMLDAKGNVAEAPGSNFFFEKDGILYTAPVENILPGITRQTVLDICREMELPVKEKFFKPEELFDVDSAFLCGTAAQISPISSIEGQKVNKPWKSSMGLIVQEAYKNIVMEKSHAYVIV